MKTIAVLVLTSAVNVPILKLFIYIWYIMDKFEEIMSTISLMGVIATSAARPSNNASAI